MRDSWETTMSQHTRYPRIGTPTNTALLLSNSNISKHPIDEKASATIGLSPVQTFYSSLEFDTTIHWASSIAYIAGRYQTHC